MGARDQRKNEGYSLEQRIRLLEQDADETEARDALRSAAVARLTQAAVGLLIALVSGMSIYFLTVPR